MWTIGAPALAPYCAAEGDANTAKRNAAVAPIDADLTICMLDPRPLYTIGPGVRLGVNPRMAQPSSRWSAYLKVLEGFTLRHAAPTTALHRRIAWRVQRASGAAALG